MSSETRPRAWPRVSSSSVDLLRPTRCYSSSALAPSGYSGSTLSKPVACNTQTTSPRAAARRSWPSPARSRFSAPTNTGGVDQVDLGQVQRPGSGAPPRNPAAAGAAAADPGADRVLGHDQQQPPTDQAVLSSVITHYPTAPGPASNTCLGCVMLLAVIGRQSGHRYRLGCRVYCLPPRKPSCMRYGRGLWHAQPGEHSPAATHAIWRAETRARSQVSVPGLTPGLLRGPSQVGPHVELHPLLRVATRRGAPEPSSSW